MEKNWILIGKGIINWGRDERIGDRYGTVGLFDGSQDNLLPIKDVRGHGKLIAHIRKTRQSYHIGDVFRGLSPKTPKENEFIELGEGTVFFEHKNGIQGRYIGLKPDEPRDSDWLNPQALYRCHSQTVDLYFAPTQTWICEECGTEYASSTGDKPTPPKWKDGHECKLTPKPSAEEQVASEQVPSSSHAQATSSHT